MENELNVETDATPSFELDAAIDKIAGEVLAEPERAAAVDGPSSVSGENQPAPAPVSMKSLPKSWKKDMEGHWAKLPPEVHEYVYSREADIMRGIQQYQTSAKQWDAAVKPFEQFLRQNPNLNPVQAFHSLMAAHLQLSQGTSEHKQEILQKLMQDYGLSAPQSASQNPLESEVSRLKQELLALKSGFTESQKRTYESAVAEQRKSVDSFFSDPKNEFAEEVQNDILRLIQTGVASDLAAAYEQACWLNPGVRAKMLAKQQAVPAGNATQPPTGKVLNVDSDPNARPAKQRKAMTIDDTINSIVAKYANSL